MKIDLTKIPKDRVQGEKLKPTDIDTKYRKVKLCLAMISFRKKRGLSQKQAANQLGITQPALCQYEKMNTIPGTSTLIKLAQAGEDLSDIFKPTTVIGVED
jgi:predicted transcriptional regulator